MGVYIKNMGKPDKCAECYFYDKEINCTLSDIDIDHRSCPIVEVPTPHGDLIDGHKLEFNKEVGEDGSEVWLWKADTIIEAEE